MASRQGKWHGRVDGAQMACIVPGCPEPGEYRAPLIPGDPSAKLGTGSDGPGTWQYLCLEHVRAHNARYNYFAGMSMDQIEAAQSPIAGWERATRAFATNGADRGPAWAEFVDPLDAIATRFRPETGGGMSSGGRLAASAPPNATRWACWRWATRSTGWRCANAIRNWCAATTPTATAATAASKRALAR